MARPKLDHDEQRNKIAAAACEVILEVGLENARLAEIGARAGVTTGAVQHYFRSKEELLFFAKNSVFDLIFAKTSATSPPEDGVERLFHILDRHLPCRKEHIKAARLLEVFRGSAVGNAALLRNQHKRDMRFLAVLEEEIGRLHAQGLTHKDLDLKQAALGLNAMLDGLGCIVMPAPAAFKDYDVHAIVEDYVCSVIGLPRPPADWGRRPAARG